MIEPEMAFTDLSGNMDLAEEIVKYLYRIFARNVRKSWDFSRNLSTRNCSIDWISYWNALSRELPTPRQLNC